MTLVRLALALLASATLAAMIATAPITREEIEAARRRIAGDVRRTPLMRLRGKDTIEELAGGRAAQ